jgi:hypothetical protein
MILLSFDLSSSQMTLCVALIENYIRGTMILISSKKSPKASIIISDTSVSHFDLNSDGSSNADEVLF